MNQLVVAAGPLEAVILPDAGARLHRLRAFGHDLLRTPPNPATHLRDPFFWGAYVLAPWANRIEAAPTAVGDRTVRPAANFEDGSAIHGQVYAGAWERDQDELRIQAGGDDAWPWPYEVTLRATAAGSALRLDLALANRADAPMPAGLGWHPWWRQPVEVAIRAGSVLRTTSNSPPLAEPVAGRLDRRALGQMPFDLDAAWSELDDPPVVLRWPDVGVRLTMRGTGDGLHVVAASPPQLDAVAVELQTHAPQGLRRLLRGEPGPLAVIPPGGRLTLGIELTAEQEDG